MEEEAITAREIALRRSGVQIPSAPPVNPGTAPDASDCDCRHAVLGHDHATVYGGLIGVDYLFGQEPPPAVFKK
jgi:hypothetical protein